MNQDLTKGPVMGSMLRFALPIGVMGIWWSVPIGWFLADLVGAWYYLLRKDRLFEWKM